MWAWESARINNTKEPNGKPQEEPATALKLINAKD